MCANINYPEGKLTLGDMCGMYGGPGGRAMR